jgi:ATP-dependent Lon protease
VQSLCVGRNKSRLALDAAMDGERYLLLIAQREAMLEEPDSGDLYTVGTIAECLQMLNLPDGTIRVTVEGLARVQVSSYTREDPYLEAATLPFEDEPCIPKQVQALMRVAVTIFERCIHVGNRLLISSPPICHYRRTRNNRCWKRATPLTG